MDKYLKYTSILRRISAVCFCFLILSAQFYGLSAWAGYSSVLVSSILFVFELSVIATLLCLLAYLCFFVYKFIKLGR